MHTQRQALLGLRLELFILENLCVPIYVIISYGESESDISIVLCAKKQQSLKYYDLARKNKNIFAFSIMTGPGSGNFLWNQ